MPKITELPAATSFNLTDLLAKVNDPSGTPITQRGTISQLVALLQAQATLSSWDTVVTKSADQTVTNNSTLQNDSELIIPITVAGHYQVELLLLYSGNDAAGDFQGQFLFADGGGNQTLGNYVYPNTSMTASNVPSFGLATIWPNGAMTAGTDNLDTIIPAQLRFTSSNMGIGNLQWKFANVAAGVGRTSTCRAGSTLRLKHMFPL